MIVDSWGTFTQHFPATVWKLKLLFLNSVSFSTISFVVLR